METKMGGRGSKSKASAATPVQPALPKPPAPPMRVDYQNSTAAEKYTEQMLKAARESANLAYDNRGTPAAEAHARRAQDAADKANTAAKEIADRFRAERKAGRLSVADQKSYTPILNRAVKYANQAQVAADQARGNVSRKP